MTPRAGPAAPDAEARGAAGGALSGRRGCAGPAAAGDAGPAGQGPAIVLAPRRGRCEERGCARACRRKPGAGSARPGQ